MAPDHTAGAPGISIGISGKEKETSKAAKNCRWMAKMPAASHMRNGTPLSPLDHGMGSGGRADQDWPLE